MIKKNDDLEVNISDIGYEGEGIAKIDGYTTFIKGGLKGEKVKIKMLKVNKNFGFAKLLEVLEKSDEREEPICNAFGKCGGCNLQHINYDNQLKIKTENVVSKQENTDVGAHICIAETTEKSNNIVGTTDWTEVTFCFNSKNRTKVKLGFRLGGYEDEVIDLVQSIV